MSIITTELGIEDGKLILPRGRSGVGGVLIIDIREIDQYEGRIAEIARATPLTLPDLITDFNLAIAKISRAAVQVEIELRNAERALSEAKSCAILERVEDFLRAKNIKSTSDTREAAIDADVDVKMAKEKVDILKAVSTFLKDKTKAFEMAYYGAREVTRMNTKTPDQRLTGGETGSY